MTASDSTRHELKGISLAAASAVAFGTLAIFAKLAYDMGAEPIPLLALRFSIATAILAVVNALRPNKTRTAPRRVGILLLLGAGGYAVESSLFFAALEHADASVVGLVFYSYPLWTSIIALTTRLEPYRPQLLIALILGSVGVSLVFSFSPTGAKGPILALAAAVAVAFYLIGLQVWTRGIDPTATALWTSAAATVAYAVAALVVRQEFPLEAMWPAAGLGVATAIAFILLYSAIARIGSSRSAIAAMLEPVTTVLLGAMFLNEELSWQIAAGTILIVSALPVLASAAGKDGVVAPPAA